MQDPSPDIGPDERQCQDCKKVKPLDNYKLRSDGRRDLKCQPCRRTHTRLYIRERRARGDHADPRANNLWIHYKIYPEDYDELREHQGRRCAICNRHEDEIPESRAGRPRLDGTRREAMKLVIDHCHDSKVIRGLLCGPCNQAIGFLFDDPKRADAAADYLRRGGSGRLLHSRSEPKKRAGKTPTKDDYDLAGE